ncbi:uncharacterized protein N7469_003263 [Penicillium citrinum]|uniref:Uncharacterized protein n=1 Tax=Penicillium citrinum TaxID=5077 RepID=A0A9W9TUG7_PENCI|nr:uncharacterized protein N7469_003263 [Penicillium citrinum]KAJ5241672.1 hypothetical protein N7469_003263 [Penicillium citrinum]
MDWLLEFGCSSEGSLKRNPHHNPDFWIDEEQYGGAVRHVFRSATDEEIPLFKERMQVFLRSR